MKTTDLIPLILYQLVDGDKYGYEIVKQIEDISNGSIVIKQPTLYSVLKKLEQGKFISSYWQDSEIGGKRHYYKLTENGKFQLDTYPALDVLIKDTVGEAVVEVKSQSSSENNEPQQVMEEQMPYIAQNEPLVEQGEVIDIGINEQVTNANDDYNTDNNEIKPVHIDLTSPTTFVNSDFGLDLNQKPEIKVVEEDAMQPQDLNITTDYINIFDAIEPEYTNNAQISNNPELEQQEQPVSIEKIEPIAEPVVDNKLYDKLTPNQDLLSLDEELNEEESLSPAIEQIKYLNYVDLSTDKTSLKRKKAVAKHIQKMILTTISLILALISSVVICNKYGFSNVYCICAVLVGLIIVVYPILVIKNVPKQRLKYCTTPFIYSVFQDFIVKLALFLSLIIVIFGYNLSIANTVKEIFLISNFASFFAPIIFASMLLLDFIYNLILFKQYKK